MLISDGNSLSPCIIGHLRSVQILAILMNEVHQKVILSVATIGAILVAALSFTIAVQTLHTDQNLAISGMAVIFVVNVFMLFLILFRGLSQLHAEYSQCRQLFRESSENSCCVKREKLFLRKFCNGLTPIRVKFGVQNYTESFTALNCIDFINQLTVQLLLVTK